MNELIERAARGYVDGTATVELYYDLMRACGNNGQVYLAALRGMWMRAAFLKEG